MLWNEGNDDETQKGGKGLITTAAGGDYGGSEKGEDELVRMDGGNLWTSIVVWSIFRSQINLGLTVPSNYTSGVSSTL